MATSQNAAIAVSNQLGAVVTADANGSSNHLIALSVSRCNCTPRGVAETVYLTTTEAAALVTALNAAIAAA
jgi:hypothetical protein